MPVTDQSLIWPDFSIHLGDHDHDHQDAKNEKPAMITTSFGNPNIKPPFSTRSGLFCVEHQSEKTFTS